MTPLQITGYAALTYFLIGLVLGIFNDIKAVYAQIYKHAQFSEKMQELDLNFTQTRVAMVLISIFAWPIAILWDIERIIKEK